MKHILILNSHSETDSVGTVLATSFAKGARSAKHRVELVRICDLTFDPILHHGYLQSQPLEPDLKKIQTQIKAADHIVIFYPTWWGTVPALFKGLIDRIFLPGFGYNFDKKTHKLKKLLTGKTAAIVTTTGAPFLISFLGPACYGVKLLKHGLLGFCGIKTIQTKFIGSAESMPSERLEKLKKEFNLLGQSV